MHIAQPRKLRETTQPILIHDHINPTAHELVLAELQRSDVIPARALALLSEDDQRAIPAIAKDTGLMRDIQRRVQALPSAHSVVLGDSRHLSIIPSESVHLALTSPPYWTLKKYIDRRTIAQLGNDAGITGASPLGGIRRQVWIGLRGGRPASAIFSHPRRFEKHLPEKSLISPHCRANVVCLHGIHLAT